ncbi:MAG: hypothetical protein NT171_08645, partial [Planctomycetota bacterium]|nr:hypothetical protein [Planctomycetota bacterium]
ELHDLRSGWFNLGGGSAVCCPNPEGDGCADNRMNCRQPAMGPMALLGFESMLSHGREGSSWQVLQKPWMQG